MHRILEINADAVALYLNTQIEAGAQAVMIFDSWGGVLADGAFQQFSLAYTARVLAQLKTEHQGARIPRIVFTKGGGLWLPEMGALDCEVLGLDWTMNLGTARALVGGSVGGPGKALQGNIDPMCCLPRPSTLPPRCGACSTALADHTPMPAPPARPTSSIWDTASASSPRPSMSRPWWRRCTATPKSCARSKTRGPITAGC